MRYILIVCCLVPFAAGAADLPQVIELTQDDAQEINDKRELHDRPVAHAVADWNAEQARWDGLQVHTGRKSDVVAWFVGGCDGLDLTGGFQNVRPLRHFQYDLLCSQLLQTGDDEIIRAMLWHAPRTGAYVAPDWLAISEDRGYSLAERLVAWQQAHAGTSVDAEVIKAFWAGLGRELTADVVAEVAGRRGSFPWQVFQGRPGGELPALNEIDAILLPLLDREYLSVNKGALVSNVLQQLWRLHGPGDAELLNRILDRIAEIDVLGDERSVRLWTGMRPAAIGDAAAARLRRMMIALRLPQNAAWAFYAYAATPVGRREMQDESGVAAYLRDYVRAAFVTAETTDAQIRRLRAVIRPPAPWGNQRPAQRLLPMLQGKSIELELTKEQNVLLQRAWREVPKLLEQIEVVEVATAEPPQEPAAPPANEEEAPPIF